MDGAEISEIKDDADVPTSLASVYGYWRSLDGGDGLPPARDFKLDALEPQVLPWSVLMDVEADPPDFRFRFWGTERVRMIGAEMTGRRLSDVPDEKMREGNRREYVEVCERKRPLLCRTPITTSFKAPVSVISIRLPLFDDAGRVVRVFSSVDPESVRSEIDDEEFTQLSF